MTMIEQMARAIGDAEETEGNSLRKLFTTLAQMTDTPWDEAKFQRSMQFLAGAALEAAREPTAAMGEAGLCAIVDALTETPYGAGIALSAPDNIWRAIIDAALAEPTQ